MKMPTMILVPTDFGEPSEAALDYALELARVLGAEIALMHAYELPMIGMPDGTIIATADMANRILEGAKLGLDRQLASRQTAGVPVRAIIKQGDARQAVNETAEEVKAGLIVMGTHGRRGLPRALIGSVAEKVVRTAKVPVLTVHAGEAAPAEAGETKETKRAQAASPPPANGVAPSQR
jgi:nucleotide-binding universal stress UspA family protein